MAEQFKLKRYYFGRLELHTSRLMLSVITSSDLPKNLKVIKKSLGIPLVRFEEANVELGEPWQCNNTLQLGFHRVYRAHNTA